MALGANAVTPAPALHDGIQVTNMKKAAFASAIDKLRGHGTIMPYAIAETALPRSKPLPNEHDAGQSTELADGFGAFCLASRLLH